MRKRIAALFGFLLVAALPGGAQPGGATPAPSAAKPAAAGTTFELEDASLPASVKEQLQKEYAKRLKIWAMVQPIVQAVVAQQASPQPMESVQAIDAAWQRGEDPQGLATALAQNRCAKELQKALAANLAYREAFVTDDRGVLVCMSHRTSDYWQGDDEKWSRAFAGGAGAVFVSKAVRDASTGLELVHISLPVRSAGRVVGVLVVGWMPPPG